MDLKHFVANMLLTTITAIRLAQYNIPKWQLMFQVIHLDLAHQHFVDISDQVLPSIIITFFVVVFLFDEFEQLYEISFGHDSLLSTTA